MFDPFEVLGLDKGYPLDFKVLEKSYFEAQKETHPDRFVGASDDKKREVLKRSGEVNGAYLLLKDPLQRAAFLLKAAGVELLSHDAAFLSQVMDWNERLEGGEDLGSELNQKQETFDKALEEAFDAQDYEKARVAHYRLTYVKKMLKDLNLMKG